VCMCATTGIHREYQRLLFLFYVRTHAYRCLLRSNVRRRSFKVFISHLQIMLSRHRLGVSNPLANHVNRKRLRQFRFPG
jgi:hypothetical protein